MSSNSNTPPIGLNGLLYFLYSIPEVNQTPILRKELVEQIKNKYQKSTVSEICKGLKWALANTDYDFSSQLPNLNKTNDEIKVFLQKISIVFDENNICS